ncbi:hypothetical protein [Providencia alcalifaciens]|uniref:hypothetical protein n=1 Tax=Providencia alcalifaciens TaxID=126385 RepID=UPI003D2B58BF
MKYLLTVVLLLMSGIAYSKCDSNNFDQCKTCDQLDKAIVLSDPDKGDYYRGAFWNGLYASYVRNCQNVAKKLLDNGATPSLGGHNYALPVVISGNWPHENKSINEEWKNLLLKYNVKLDLIPEGEKSPFEVFLNNPKAIYYKDIWAELIVESDPKPVDPARNIEWCASDDNANAITLVLSSCINNGMNDLEDGISTVSDVADAIISSCDDYIRGTSNLVLCRLILKHEINKPEQQEIAFNKAKMITYENTKKFQRDDLIRRLLTNRTAAKKSKL